MKSLKILITLAKVGRVLSKIVFIISLVGAILALLTIIALKSVGGELNPIGGNLHLTIVDVQDYSAETIYAYMGVAVLICAGEVFVARKAVKYFEHVLSEGTPFTTGLSTQLRDLGITNIAVSLGMVIVCSAALAAAKRFYPDLPDLRVENTGSISMGISMLVCSALCRYAAELREQGGTGTDALPSGDRKEKEDRRHGPEDQ